jgi:hypothetical protein
MNWTPELLALPTREVIARVKDETGRAVSPQAVRQWRAKMGVDSPEGNGGKRAGAGRPRKEGM